MLARAHLAAGTMAALVCGWAAAQPVGSGFTYQGSLRQSGQPFSGNANLEFRLFDAATGGAQVGGPVTLPNVPVTGGVFTVQLNAGGEFGGSAFAGQARWLAITVNGTPLSPRQELTAAPYATFSTRPWETGGANTFFLGGSVGIGTSAPASALDVRGSVTLDAGISPSVYTGTGTSELNRYLNVLNSTGLPSASGLKAGGVLVADNFFYANPGKSDLIVKGKVGIGTPTPAQALTIQTSFPAYGWAHTDGTRTTTSFLDTQGGWLGTLSNHPLHFFTNNSNPRMTVTTGGIVGIGTTAPNPATLLNVVAGPGVVQAVRGDSSSGNGVVGTSAAAGFSANAGIHSSVQGIGVYGQLVNPSTVNLGAFARPGVWGDSGTGNGVIGTTSANGGAGMVAWATSGHGIWAIGGSGTPGHPNPFTLTGVRGEVVQPGGVAVWGDGAPGSWAGYFSGDANVGGNLVKSSGSFLIDHPVDPENKYLYHSFVESPDMMNIYNGNVVLDENGRAVVVMPDWFMALNRDFRYQLTALGGPGPNLHVARELEDGRFSIAGGAPGLKVSWQVTGIRQDAYANANRIPVEEEKSGDERGRYLHPEAFGQPPEMQILKRARDAAPGAHPRRFAESAAGPDPERGSEKPPEPSQSAGDTQ